MVGMGQAGSMSRRVKAHRPGVAVALKSGSARWAKPGANSESICSSACGPIRSAGRVAASTGRGGRPRRPAVRPAVRCRSRWRSGGRCVRRALRPSSAASARSCCTDRPAWQVRSSADMKARGALAVARRLLVQAVAAGAVDDRLVEPLQLLLETPCQPSGKPSLEGVQRGVGFVHQQRCRCIACQGSSVLQRVGRAPAVVRCRAAHRGAWVRRRAPGSMASNSDRSAAASAYCSLPSSV